MAAAIAIPHLAPRPASVPMAAWNPASNYLSGKENSPVSKLHNTTSAVRPRRERPCDGCRRRKSKCVLQDSRRCVLCEFHKQECTFVEKAQPRKRKPPVEASSDTASVTSRKSPALSSPKLAPRSHAQTPAPRSAPLSPMPAPTSFVVDESLSLRRHHYCKLLGQTTALDTSLIGLGNFSNKNETPSQLGVLRQVAPREYFSTHADADMPLPDDEARALADVEAIVGPHGSTLAEVYFRNVHPSFPILQKTAFMDRRTNGDRRFNPALIAAMYILAIGWWEHEESLASHPKPDVNKLEQIAIGSLMMSMQRPKISGVQAGLLLLQRSKASTWTLTVQLVALGQEIGLHLDCSNWSIPLWERRLRKRVAWALYMQDKWSALMHGRPSHINPADWAAPMPSIEDFDESVGLLPTPGEEVPDDQTIKGRSIFVHMISLTQIMSEVCETFYSQSAQDAFAQAGTYSAQLVLSRAKPVQLKLKAWFADLPPECKMDHDSVMPTQLSSTGYLHLGYFATEITIHRRIVSSLSSSTNPDQYMLYICRSAAKTRLVSAMEFVNRLRPEHLHAFWYFASTANFALIGTFGALLQSSSPSREEAEFYAARLNEFRWTLDVCMKQAPWIRGALNMLDANGELLKGLGPKPGFEELQRQHPPQPAQQRSGLGLLQQGINLFGNEDDVGEEDMDVDD